MGLFLIKGLLMELTIEEVYHAYYDCRKHKTNKESVIEFHMNLAENLNTIYDELKNRTYSPSGSTVFVHLRPKPREVWAANFRDRVVHHILYNRISDYFHKRFSADSCACIPNRGTLYGVNRLESHIRKFTKNWSEEKYYLKCDFQSFFVSINKNILFNSMKNKIKDEFSLWLTEVILFNDPTDDFVIRSSDQRFDLIPDHKSLFHTPIDHGLPVGNLSSQFFANVLLDLLDQYIKRVLKVKFYIRYVDDFIILGDSTEELKQTLSKIEKFVKTIQLNLNPKKTIIQPINHGVDFAGWVIRPHRKQVRVRSFITALFSFTELKYETINSYLGLMQHSNDYKRRAYICHLSQLCGCSVNFNHKYIRN